MPTLKKHYFQFMKQFKNYVFSNWAGNETCLAQKLFQPETEDEIQAVLTQCNNEHKRLRIIGSGHSWSPVSLSRDFLMSLDRYQQILNLNREKHQVTVRAGIKLWQLNEYLYKQGYSLKNLGSVSAQSVAGAINTATHGSGIQFQILASQVASFKIILPNGNVLQLSKETDSDLFHLILVGLGSVGIISEVTLDIVPRYHLHEISEMISFDEASASVLHWIHECDHLKLWWFPHIDRIMVYRYYRTQEHINDSKFRQVFFDEVLAKTGFKTLLWLGNKKPLRRPAINRFICTKLLNSINRVEKSWKIFNVPMPPVHRETEWAFDIQKTPLLLNSYRDLINQGKHLVNFVQEIRFVKGDSFALSPCHKRDSIYIGAYHASNKDWLPLFHDFELFAKQHEGRPHWGKEFTVDTNYLKKQFSCFNDFCSKRNYMDPKGILLNDMTEQLFSSGY